MTFIKIYYIKKKSGEIIYTNTNPNEFGLFVKNYLNLKLKTFPTYKLVKEQVTDYDIGAKEIEIDL